VFRVACCVRAAKERGVGIAEEIVDLGLAGGLGGRIELAEEAEEVVRFEVETLEGIIGAAAFDGGPFDNGGGGGAEWVAHVRLLEDFFGTRTCAGGGDELLGFEGGALDAVDEIEEAELDGVGEGDAVVEIPGGEGILGF